MQIQLGKEPELEKIEPKQSSTPLTKEKIKEIYEKEKTDYLKIATKLHEIDLQAVSEVADSENENLYREIIDPTPGLTLDDEIDVDNQFSFRTDSDTSYTLPNALKSKLENILEDARDKVNSISFTPKPVEKIPNNPLYNEAELETEDFYIDESFKNLFYHPEESIYFPKLSTDDRKDFEVNVLENDMIVFKSPSLSLVSVEKKEIKNFLDKIIEDLNLNITETLMTRSNKVKTEQKIFILENLKKKLKTNKNIEDQISHGWLNQLVEDQLKQNKKYYKLDKEYENKELKNKFKNITTRKRKMMLLTSEDRLKETPSIYSLIPADKTKKIESAKNIFSNIIKNIPPESYKKFKIYYDQSNDINISETSDDGKLAELIKYKG